MHRLIWVFAGHTCHFVGFVMRRLKFHIEQARLLAYCSTEVKFPEYLVRSIVHTQIRIVHSLPFLLHLMGTIYFTTFYGTCKTVPFKFFIIKAILLGSLFRELSEQLPLDTSWHANTILILLSKLMVYLKFRYRRGVVQICIHVMAKVCFGSEFRKLNRWFGQCRSSDNDNKQSGYPKQNIRSQDHFNKTLLYHNSLLM